MYGAILGAAASIGSTFLNNYLSGQRTQQDRRENYVYGEKAANAADERTRALYGDFYSPEALMRQYKEAGLSPSMMFGGTPGQGGMSGAQGTGSAGIQTPFMPMSIVEAAQAANLMAQTKKTNAETKNIEQDTTIKDLEAKTKQLELTSFKQSWNIINNINFANAETGEPYGLYDLAENCSSFDEFLNKTRKLTDNSYSNENEIQTLRSIYEAANRFERDLTVLSSETVNAKFQQSIQEALINHDYANMNADTAIKILRQEAATNELTAQQKEAWDHLLDHIGKKGSTGRDIAIVMGMILSSFMGKVGVKINTGK